MELKSNLPQGNKQKEISSGIIKGSEINKTEFSNIKDNVNAVRDEAFDPSSALPGKNQPGAGKRVGIGMDPINSSQNQKDDKSINSNKDPQMGERDLTKKATLGKNLSSVAGGTNSSEKVENIENKSNLSQQKENQSGIFKGSEMNKIEGAKINDNVNFSGAVGDDAFDPSSVLPGKNQTGALKGVGIGTGSINANQNKKDDKSITNSNKEPQKGEGDLTKTATLGKNLSSVAGGTNTSGKVDKIEIKSNLPQGNQQKENQAGIFKGSEINKIEGANINDNVNFGGTFDPSSLENSFANAENFAPLLSFFLISLALSSVSTNI